NTAIYGIPHASSGLISNSHCSITSIVYSKLLSKVNLVHHDRLINRDGSTHLPNKRQSFELTTFLNNVPFHRSFRGNSCMLHGSRNKSNWRRRQRLPVFNGNFLSFHNCSKVVPGGYGCLPALPSYYLAYDFLHA
ncbi:unnamed protein product, partial [Linum tenue]